MHTFFFCSAIFWTVIDYILYILFCSAVFWTVDGYIANSIWSYLLIDILLKSPFYVISHIQALNIKHCSSTFWWVKIIHCVQHCHKPLFGLDLDNWSRVVKSRNFRCWWNIWVCCTWGVQVLFTLNLLL